MDCNLPPVFLVFSLLAACGSNQSPNTSAPEPESVFSLTTRPDLSTVPTVAFTLADLGRTYDIEIDGTNVFTASDKYLARSDITNPAAVTTQKFEAFVEGRELVLSGTHILFADRQGGLKSILSETDAEGVANYVLKSAVNSIDARDVVIAGTNAYVADFGQGLRVIDITDPGNMSLGHKVATGQTFETAMAVVTNGNYAYVANTSDFVNVGVPSIAVVDISAAVPAIAKKVNDAGVAGESATFSSKDLYSALDLEVKEVASTDANGAPTTKIFLFVASGSTGVAIFDVSKALDAEEGAKLVGTINTGTAYSLSLVGNNLYVADRFKGFSVIDVANPEAPVWKHRFSFSNIHAGDVFHVTEGSDYVVASVGLLVKGVWNYSVMGMTKASLEIQ